MSVSLKDFHRQLVAYFTIFLDLMGYAIVLPIFAPLFLSSHSGWLNNYSYETRCAFLVLLLFGYTFAHWLGSSFFSYLAILKGRRPVLLITLALTSLAYATTAFGFLHEHLALVYLGRFLGGFSAGNYSFFYKLQESVANPMLAGGLGLIIGPLIVGILVDEALHVWFFNALPFWIMSCLTFVNLILVAVQKRTEDQTFAHFNTFLNLKESLKILFSQWKIKTWSRSCSAAFLFLLAWFSLIQFASAFLFMRFNLSESGLGFAFALLGVGWCAGQFFRKLYALSFFILVAGLCIFISIFTENLISFLLFMAVVTIICSYTWANLGLFFKNVANEENADDITLFVVLNITFAALLSTLLSGTLLLIDYRLIYVFVAFCFFISAFLNFTSRPNA